MHHIKNFHDFVKSKISLSLPYFLASVATAIFITIGAALIIVFIINLLLARTSDLTKTKKELGVTNKAYLDLKNQDQYKINQSLIAEVSTVSANYKKVVGVYQDINDIDVQKGKSDPLKKGLAQFLSYLSDRNYASSDATFALLSADVKKEKDRIAATLVSSSGGSIDPTSVKQSNAPPGSGFSRQSVSVLGSNYVVDIIAGDLSSTRVIVDTASDGDCGNNCPVMSVGDYAARSGAYAGVNGSYFCPADYPSCAGKTNSFDTLAMNKNKVYFNSGNNVYSTVPAVIFMSGSVRFVGQSLQWGRDTGVDGVLANQGLLVSGGNDVYGDDGDPKKGSRGSRSFVASRGNMVYIGTAHNVTVAEMAHVLQAMGMEGALNLDSGGSVALWANGGYQDGPGRSIPNAILFVRK